MIFYRQYGMRFVVRNFDLVESIFRMNGSCVIIRGMRWTILPIFLAGMLAGCVHKETRTPVTQPSMGELVFGGRQIEQAPADTLIWSGSLPFLQIFGPGGSLQLLDMTDRMAVWSGQVAPNSLIRIDASGVTVGSEHVSARNLRLDHQYNLVLRATSSSAIMRMETPKRNPNLNYEPEKK
jgi:hypothetical protein